MTTIVDNIHNARSAPIQDSEPLTEAKIRHIPGLSEILPEDFRIVCYDTVGSTNTEAKMMGDEGIPTLFVAEEQTGGRGRLGKSFTCPRGKGVYMSLLIYPRAKAPDALRLTALAAVATRRVIQRLTGLDTGIKWVNDLYHGGRKLAGILTEGRVGPTGDLEYAVIGIGINLHEADLGELNKIATSIDAEGGRPTARAELIGGITAEILRDLQTIDSTELVDEYIAHSIIGGRRITLTRGDIVTHATAVRVERNLSLLVRYDDGTEERVSSGDVSLKIN